MQAILGGGALGDETSPVSDEGAEFADVMGRDPDLGDDVGCEELGQGEGVAFVGLDGSRRDELDVVGVGDGDAGNEGLDDVVDEPGVGGGLQDDGIAGPEVLGSPVFELEYGGPPGMEDDLLLGIDATRDQVVLVEVESDEAVDVFRHS
jgi:hypothetical protein